MPDKKKIKSLLERAVEYISKGEVGEARLVLTEVLELEPSNWYAYRLIKEVWTAGGEIPDKDKRKNRQYWTSLHKVKCCKCRYWILLNDMPKAKQILLKEGRYDGLEIVCPICSSKTTINAEKPNTILGYYAWDKLSVKWVWEFSISWNVQYKWYWFDSINNEKWPLEYLEWTAYSENWEILYLSESTSYDWIYDEIEFWVSTKITPNFNISEVTDKWIKIWDLYIPFSEVNNVKVKKVHWTSTKKYTIGETVFLWYFKYSWVDYCVEVESKFRQREVSLYKLGPVFFEKRDALKVAFYDAWKMYDKVPHDPDGTPLTWKDEFLKKRKFKMLVVFIVCAVSSFSLFFFAKGLLAEQYKLEEIKEGWKYYLKIEDNSAFELEKTLSARSYSRWGTQTKTVENEWIMFELSSDKDFEILKELIEIKDKAFTSSSVKELLDFTIYKKD